MLILTREKGEKVVIGEDIYVTVVEIRGSRVRLGFEAAQGVPIDRVEIRLLKDKNRKGRKE